MAHYRSFPLRRLYWQSGLAALRPPVTLMWLRCDSKGSAHRVSAYCFAAPPPCFIRDPYYILRSSPMSPPLRLTAEARLPCRFAPTSEVSQLSTHRVLFDAASREVFPPYGVFSTGKLLDRGYNPRRPTPSGFLPSRRFNSSPCLSGPVSCRIHPWDWMILHILFHRVEAFRLLVTHGGF